MPGRAVEVEEQLFLCEDWQGAPDMATARKRLADLRGSRHAAATVSAYESDWKDFIGWCHTAGRNPMPAVWHHPMKSFQSLS